MADGAGVEQIAFGVFEAQSATRLVSAWVKRQYFQFGILVSKAALMMGMAKEGDLAGGIQKAFQGLRGSEDVFVFVLEGAVDENDALGFEGALGRPASQSRFSLES